MGIDGDSQPPQPGRGEIATPIEYETRRIGMLIHAPRLLESPEFTASFIPMLRIAMERDRLHRDLVAKLEQLQASRLRLVRAGDSERRRLERNLHDGAQQRLTTTLLTLRTLEAEVVGDRGLTALVARTLEELQSAIDDLREIARGLHPPLLAREGLESALRAGATRATVPVEVDVRIPGRLPPAVEAAAYFFAAEALANAFKHARASSIAVTVRRREGAVEIEVTDDGIGGAAARDAGGLAGLEDRIAALDGHTTIESPAGRGTTARAVLPAG